MIDFSKCKTNGKMYNGANGTKRAIIYNGKRYMLKTPGNAAWNNELSYSNSCISEYLGSHIFQILGIEAQNTLLGVYQFKPEQEPKEVVACEDFTSIGITLQDFGSLKNYCIDSKQNGYGTELSDILYAIKTHEKIDNKKVLEHFWNMFIVDAFLGNCDRHNGNWGFLFDEINDRLEIAPIYDCGSCLYPQAGKKTINDCFSNEDELNIRIYERPYSAIKVNGNKIRYFDFLSKTEDIDCQEALIRISERIDLNKIDELIYSSSVITNERKDFYSFMLKKRKELILDYSLEQIRDYQVIKTKIR